MQIKVPESVQNFHGILGELIHHFETIEETVDIIEGGVDEMQVQYGELIELMDEFYELVVDHEEEIGGPEHFSNFDRSLHSIALRYRMMH